MQSEKINR